MLEVLRTTKQRFRNVLKKSVATDDDELEGMDDERLLQEVRRLEERLNLSSEDEEIDSEMDEDLDADDDTDDD